MLEGVLDVIYNPARTQLLLDAEALHIPCANGLWMLVAQAKESAEYFTGTSIDDAAIAEIHANLAAQMANIVLIGMPGCGKAPSVLCWRTNLAGSWWTPTRKSSVLRVSPSPQFRGGRRDRFPGLGDESAVPAGQTVRAGHRHRRRLCDPAAKLPDASPERRDFLAETGHFQAAHRRPSLSQTNPLDAMFAKRAPMYAAFADHAVSNDGTAEETVAAILSIMEEPI